MGRPEDRRERALARVLLARGGRLRRVLHAAPHPHHEQRGQRAGPEHHAPGQVAIDQREDRRVDDHGQGPAHGPGALHRAERAAPVLGAGVLGDQDRADRPLAAEAQALEGAEDQQRLVVGGETAGHGEHRVGDDGQQQRLDPADAVREDAREGAADRRDDQRHGGQQPGLTAVQTEVRGQRHHRQRQREVVVRIQGIAAESAAEGTPPLGPSARSQPNAPSSEGDSGVTGHGLPVRALGGGGVVLMGTSQREDGGAGKE